MVARILIVEDELEIANIEQLALEGYDVEIVHFTAPPKALEFLEAQTPDLLVLDIGLPGMTGWQLLEQVKAEGLLPDAVPVVITTAFSDPANRVVGKLQAVTRYLTKPFAPAEFRAVVADLLSLE